MSWGLKSLAIPQLNCMFNSLLKVTAYKTWKLQITDPLYWPFVRGIHQSLVDSHHKGPVMEKAFPCHDIIMLIGVVALANVIPMLPFKRDEIVTPARLKYDLVIPKRISVSNNSQRIIFLGQIGLWSFIEGIIPQWVSVSLQGSCYGIGLHMKFAWANRNLDTLIQ